MFASLLLSLAVLASQASQATAADTAALVVGARTVTVFRAPFGPATAGERVELAKFRISQLLRDGADSISSFGLEGWTVIHLGHFPAFVLTPADVDSLRGETMEAKVQGARAGLALVVAEYVEARSVRSIIRAAALSLVATVLLLLLLRGLSCGRAWLQARSESVQNEMLSVRFPRLARIIHPEGIARAIKAALHAATWFIGLTAAYLYLTFVLTSFPWTRPAGEALGSVLKRVLTEIGQGMRDGIPDLIAIIVISFLAVLLGRLLDRLFRAVALRNVTIPGFHPETAEPTRRIAKGLLWMFAVILMYPYLPASDSAAFKGVSVFAGLLVSFGSAGIAGQLMSGLALMYSRGYHIGDFVMIGSHQGTVRELGLLTTRLRTVKDEYVSIPNSVVLTGGTVNYSAAGREGHTLTIYTSATIGYDVARTEVESLMLEAARGSSAVVASPAPFVLMRALGDYSIEYQLNAAIDAGRARELPQIYSALHSRVYDAFARAGVEILSPSYFALRDGNRMTIPEAIRPDLPAGSFRVKVDGTRS
ncbi:MAG: mechanosensitive ion channel family protein [Gemmatimonadota bacterium]|nr:mechanosensitive ion channel family protein [Gemmatimonadota bacterium]MDH4347396.1 mechanosensitive ion channel family protein [Gemmatimonadota bacterium]MDH5282348.1 mechanosensitive ion channel family protein [Gemmatimonadota bacterium]